MRLALIGYGKMGKAIERLALERGHVISHKLDLNNSSDISKVTPETADVAIEFSQPDSAFENISKCLRNGVPLIAGTTGWLDKLDQIRALCEEKNVAFIHSSNYSLGVNIFFELNQWLAEKMKGRGYSLSMKEVHHTEKLDSPSGTAIRTAEGLMAGDNSKNGWLNEETTDQTKIGIVSKREPNVPGTHSVLHSSQMETIELIHTAHSRDIFASGAMDVAEWIADKKGFLTMNDYLNDLK